MAKSAKTRYGACSWCYSRGHDAHGCTSLQSSVETGNAAAISLQKKINGITARLCGYCADEKHSSTVCPKRFADYKNALLNQKSDADKAFDWLKEIGFGPGAMLSGMARESGWNSKNKEDKIVVIEEFRGHTLNRFMNELLHGSNRNWYPVTAVDTTNETVRNIYLPFHFIYAPRPTSKGVQVVHRANDQDIEGMKRVVDCYSSPVLHFSTAEDFFNAGYKFKAGKSKDPQIDDTLFKANKK